MGDEDIEANDLLRSSFPPLCSRLAEKKETLKEDLSNLCSQLPADYSLKAHCSELQPFLLRSYKPQ